MMTDTAKPPLRYEDAAEYKTDIDGWICIRCRHYWGANEHAARCCCAADIPCYECGGRRESKTYACCMACRQRHKDERWAKLERAEWDGKTPLSEWGGDRYFFDANELIVRIAGHVEGGGSVENIRLVLTQPKHSPCFSMADFLCDVLPDDYEPGRAFDEIDRAVNDWIKARSPFAWEPTNKAVPVETLRALVEEWLT